MLYIHITLGVTNVTSESTDKWGFVNETCQSVFTASCLIINNLFFNLTNTTTSKSSHVLTNIDPVDNLLWLRFNDRITCRTLSALCHGHCFTKSDYDTKLVSLFTQNYSSTTVCNIILHIKRTTLYVILCKTRHII